MQQVKGINGNQIQSVKLTGDPKTGEPIEFQIHFPGGCVVAEHQSDGDYVARIIIRRHPVLNTNEGTVRSVRVDVEHINKTLLTLSKTDGESLDPTGWYHFAAKIHQITSHHTTVPSLSAYEAWLAVCDPNTLLEEYALLQDARRCETVPGFMYKRQLAHEELLARMRRN